MTFQEIQNRIALKIGKINAEIQILESVNVDYNTSEGVKLDMRLRALTENIEFLRMMAFFIVSQDEQIEILTAQNEDLHTRVAALLSISERSLLRTNAAMATTRLLQSKADYQRREVDVWLKKELGESDFNLLTQAA